MTVKSVREDGESIHRAAKESGILYSMLQKRLKQDLVSVHKMGRKLVFSEEKEQALRSHLVRLSNM
jgi:hypothetical protein